MPLDDTGVWKKGKGKGRPTPKGRQVEAAALADIRELLGDGPYRRDLLIEFLHKIQDKFGHLSAAHLAALADEMRLAMAEVYEVATFYAHFDVVKEGETPPPALTIRVCDSLSCELAGAQALKSALEDGLDPSEVRVLRAPCMGRCDTAPVLELGHAHIDNATPEKVKAAIAAGDTHAHIPDYEDFAAYTSKGGYETLKALRGGSKTPDQVQDEVLGSGLRGMGGAGFPSGKKWSFVRAEAGPRYLAVNGDEGEPGTFKDRYFLEREPHTFLEGMLIAAWAVEAETAFIYMRDEYPAILHILADEIAKLEAAGKSAMIESIEGKRGLPRHRPPYVAQVGIFDRPTLVHNVETLHWICRIAREGAACFGDHGTNDRKGLRSYSVSGRVKEPGVKILPAGSTIMDLIEASGGMSDGEFYAYQPGGPSAGLLPASMNDIPLDFDTLQPHGSFIGSAAVVVLSDKDRARDQDKWDSTLLTDLCETMVDASICGLGQAAPNPILLTMKHFPEEI